MKSAEWILGRESSHKLQDSASEGAVQSALLHSKWQTWEPIGRGAPGGAGSWEMPLKEKSHSKLEWRGRKEEALQTLNREKGRRISYHRHFSQWEKSQSEAAFSHLPYSERRLTPTQNQSTFNKKWEAWIFPTVWKIQSLLLSLGVRKCKPLFTCKQLETVVL